MKKYFLFIAGCLLTGAVWVGSCGGDSKPDPCEIYSQPGCPNYIDPCEIKPQPGCPNYIDPCETNPQPGCPNYGEEPVLGNSIAIGTASYTVDVSRIEKIDNGFYYMYVQIKNAAKPLIIHTVRYSTSTTGYNIEAWIGKDLVTGRERPQEMVERYEQAGREVKMVINGGFFGGNPCSWQVSKGVTAFQPSPDEIDIYPVIGFDNQNLPYMGVMSSTSKVKKESDNSEWKITHINGSRWDDWLTLYNSCKGSRTGTNQYGTEVLCTPASGNWEQLSSYVNVRCKVDQVAAQGNMEIPKGKIVLSGNGTADDYLKSLKTGDDVYVTADYALKNNPEITSATIRNAISGYPYIILKENVVAPPPGRDAAIESGAHPRTSAGYSADNKYVYFTVVEGRNPTQAAPAISAGVTTRELAQIMQYFGAANAINLDGGGSSCMMIGKETKNFCSDGSQRPVADGFAIIRK